jgi:acetylornithine/N-succinyldiaminopimelate aminotransferase
MTAPILPVYSPPEQVFDHGRGVEIFTKDGTRYLDFIAGIAVNCLGHAHPKLVSALTEQAGKLWHTSNMFRVEGQEKLAQMYVDTTFAETVFFTNSGTEAIEGVLKLMRKYHSAGGNPERIDIITFAGAFHGRSYGGINAAANPSYLDGFGPRLPGFISVPFGDHDALKAAIGPTTAGILVEPVQGEGGCRAIPAACLQGLRALCDEHGILLAFDEVQSGAGRTGKLFAHEWAGITPDVMAVAKGVGGGFPLGALLATREAARGMVKGTHGTTYGGNPLAMAVGIAVWEELTKPEFLDNVNRIAGDLEQGLASLKGRHPDLVVELRGKGLLRGLRLTVDPKPIQALARDLGLLVGVAGDNVLRLAPPLVIDGANVREAIGIIDDALSAFKKEQAA